MQITINGQLLLSMLIESLVTNIPKLQMLQVNTDGITVKIPRSEIDNYYEICKEWEEKTRLNLEYVMYDKMIISDVNNYASLKIDGKIKYKGSFELKKEFHKDTSFKIVQIALSDYFFKGISVRETITNHKNIYDFCGRAKFKSDSYGETHSLSYDKKGNPFELIERQQKTTRYYISNKGATFLKVFPVKNKRNFINKGYLVTIFNKYIERENYDINYIFYILECEKIIQSIEDKQIKLV